MVFGADGKWTEDWKGNHEDGVWQAYKNTKGVVVTRGDGNVLYYLLNDDKNLIRQDDSYVYICETLTSPENAHNPVVASRATSAYAGSTWTGTYQDHETTMRFEPNGKFITEWKTIHLEGNWRPDKDDKKVMVYRDDGVVLHLELTDAKNLHWVEGNLDYQFAASRSSRHGAPFGAPQPPGAPNPFGTPDAPGASNPFGTVAPPPAPAPPEEIVKLTAAQARAVVLITGDNAEGTGFLVKMKGQPVVLTNIHVISNNPNLKITTSTGAPITILSCAGANDRDLAMITIKDAGFSYLELATDISDTVQPGDKVITPGNSEGGEVMLNTGGKVLGIGPQRVEIDNPIYHGNSGGPVFHVKSGKVIGVVTEALKVDVTDELDKDSFANRNSAIGHAMRYFGLRLDNVEHWENYDTEQFANETAFLDQFDKRSSALDAYLNAPDDDKPEDTIWQKDTTIMKANTNYFDLASGAADASQKMDATRTLYGELGDVADAGMSAIQNLTNFYSFDQQRAKDEIAYRKALKAELDTIGKNVSKLGSLPRSNQ